MTSGLRLLLLLPLAALLACGSSAVSTTPAATPAAYNFNGSWGAVALSTTPQSMPFNAIQGPLQVANGVVTGTLTPFINFLGADPHLCAANATSLTATGTLDSSQDLVLNFPIAGGTGTLIASLANDPQTYAPGSWQVAGGTCAMSATPMVIKGSTTATTSTTPITATLSGNWSTGATPSNALSFGNQPIIGFNGPLQFSNGTVTGTLSAQVNPPFTNCSQFVTGASSVTGTLSSGNILTLTTPVAGGTATITANLGANPQTLADASFQIVGGNCATSSTPVTFAQYAPLTGTYSGTFNVASAGNIPVSGSNTTVTAVLAQSTTANTLGDYPVTGTVKVSGACTDSISFTGFVAGGNLYPMTGPVFMGSFEPTASAIYAATYQSTNCNVSYQGTLLLQ
jgi:hypothetical protein